MPSSNWVKEYGGAEGQSRCGGGVGGGYRGREGIETEGFVEKERICAQS